MKLYYSLLLTLIVAIACTTDDTGKNNNDSELRAQFTSFYDDYINPTLAQFNSEAEELESLTLTFLNEKTESNLVNLQEQWKVSMLAWKPLEVYSLGPNALTDLTPQIYRWPVNEVFIDDYIENEAVINSSVVASKGVTSRGLAAIEYLIYAKTLEDYTNAESENLSNYLITVIQVVTEKHMLLTAQWMAYETTFKNDTSKDLSGTQSQILNAMVEKLEEIRKLKLEAPLGVDTGGTIDTELLEAHLSSFSLELITAEVKAIESFFTSSYAMEDNGIYAQLEATGSTELLNALKTQFEEIYNTIDSINSSLEQELTLEGAATVNDLNDAINRLTIYIKTDLSSKFGIIITFNDNDGD